MLCCSTFLQRASAAVPTGFVVFIVAWVMLLVVAFGFPFSTNYSKGFVALSSLFPWTVLGKGIRDLASATTGKFIYLATMLASQVQRLHQLPFSGYFYLQCGGKYRSVLGITCPAMQSWSQCTLMQLL